MVRLYFTVIAFCLFASTAFAASFDVPDGGRIGVVSSVVNVFPEVTMQDSEFDNQISISAARGESESAQVVISAGTSAVNIQKVVVSGLKSRTAAISYSAIQVELVAYADLKESSWRGVKRLGLWPDPIIAMRPFECPANESRSLWITITVPRSARAGEYTGSITIYSNTGKLAVIPINLNVWNFTLPEAPALHTSYWMDLESRYSPVSDPQAKQQMIELFGKYRTSTNIFEMPDYYLERDGRVTCDASKMKKTLQEAVKAGFRTLNLGSGCWSMASFDNVIIKDRKTGKPLEKEAQKSALDVLDAREKKKDLPGVDQWFFARMYMNDICNWLESRKLLDRCYIQLYDEEPNPENYPSIASYYCQWRQFEPRARYLGLLGVHPNMQGVFDIWSPHIVTYEKEAFRMVSEGISLKGKKSFAAEVTASSTGKWGTAAFYAYRPVDAYDGCDYTKWTPAENPTPENEQWLRYDFKVPSEIDGIRILPYEEAGFKVALGSVSLELSKNGQRFRRIKLAARESDSSVYDIPRGFYKSVKIVFSSVDLQFSPTVEKPLPSLSATVFGVREVEFVRSGLPRESTLPRERVRSSEMWEYQVGADFPGVCIDANPTEIGHTGTLMFQRKSKGYLNYGAGQWQLEGPINRVKDEDPMVWQITPSNGSAWIVYPGSKTILPSIRFARFRDGVDEYDYMTLLESIDPGNILITNFRENGELAARAEWAEAIEKSKK